jgi:ABC-type transporter Mla subunit MlaD
VEVVLVDADQAVRRTASVLDGADGAVARTSAVLDAADEAVVRTVTTLDRAEGLVTDASGLLGQTQQPLLELLPVLERLAETVDPREVDAAVLLVDRLPELLRVVDEDLLPLTRPLTSVGPELHALLELVEDLHDMVARLPGMGLVRKRRDPAE